MEKKSRLDFFLSAFFLSSFLIFVIYIPFYLTRELWFDEVLTLQFAFLPSAAEIYNTYTIPNNQIVHTIVLSSLLKWGISPETARIFPLVCGALMIYILWRSFKKEIGKLQLAIVLSALVLSPPFMLYATALRGYMLAALFTVLALVCARKYALGGKVPMLLLWFVFSTLASGVMPSALAGIAAAGLFAAPYCGRKFYKNKKLYLLAAAPFAGFLLFYCPIWNKLIAAFDLKEGWHHAGFALLAVGTGAAAAFFVPMVCGAFFHRPAIRNLPRTLIWLIPAGGALLPVAPFPRVYFVLFPVIALLIGTYLRRAGTKQLKFIAAATAVWGALILPECSRTLLTPAVTLAGQDDFFAPRFARRVFTPKATADAAAKYDAPCVFVSFEADPFALIYASEGRFKVIPDIPPGKLRRIPDGALIILASQEAPAAFETRFAGKLEALGSGALHQIYRFKDGL